MIKFTPEKGTLKTDAEIECFFVHVRTYMPNREAINDIQKEKLENIIIIVEIKDLKGHLNGILTFDQAFSHILFKLKITMAFMPT